MGTHSGAAASGAEERAAKPSRPAGEEAAQGAARRAHQAGSAPAGEDVAQGAARQAHPTSAVDPAAPWLIVGLGNPGKEYAANRHNIGFLVADLLAQRVGARFGRHRRAAADVGEGRLGIGADAPRVVLAKPLTYMNLSGGPVVALAKFYRVPVPHIVAVHDELDLPFGQVRAKVGGGEGGHNGLRSMSRSLGVRDYVRVRFGIGRPPGRQDPADFVLSNFSTVERKEVDFLVDRAADMVESVMVRGLEWTQNAYHGV